MRRKISSYNQGVTLFNFGPQAFKAEVLPHLVSVCMLANNRGSDILMDSVMEWPDLATPLFEAKVHRASWDGNQHACCISASVH